MPRLTAIISSRRFTRDGPALRPVFSTGPSIIHPIVRLDTRLMLAVRLISQRDGNLGLGGGEGGCAVQDKTSALQLG
jgi:hypothetical protein